VNPYGTTLGLTWTFTTGSLPGPSTDPAPPDGAPRYQTNPVFTWQPGAGAESHDFYFSTTNPPAFHSHLADPTFTPPELLTMDTVYYWRIDEINEFGTTQGPVWTFKTTPGGI